MGVGVRVGKEGEVGVGVGVEVGVEWNGMGVDWIDRNDRNRL